MRHLFWVAAAVLSTSGVPAIQPFAAGRPTEVRRTVTSLRVLSVALEAGADGAPAFPVAPALEPAARLRHDLPTELRRYVDHTDAWGGPLMYWSDGEAYMLVSYGSDARAQYDYSCTPPFRAVPNGLATTDPANDLIVVNGKLWQGPISDVEGLRIALAHMRAAGTAIESWSIDYNRYPITAGFVPLTALEGELEPVYIRDLPLKDPWHQDYRIWSDGGEYALVSAGADRRFEHAYETWDAARWRSFQGGATTEPGRDLAFISGQFAQWPAATLGW